MAEEKSTQKIIDDAISAVEDIGIQFSKITDVLKAAKQELSTLEKEKTEKVIQPDKHASTYFRKS